MTKQDLFQQIIKKRSFLCVGLDTDLNKIPPHLLETEDPIFEFNKSIIDSTHEYCIAYKPNLAFYECYGVKGLISFEKTIKYLNENYPEIFTIADAKRGDIGNTSKMYAEAFLDHFNFDAITIAPYMGQDSVEPFLSIKDKWVILLALTSNQGAFDFQTQLIDNEELYKKVLKTSKRWANDENMMYVVGATKAEMLAEIREIIPDHFLLVPGVGAQGGSLSEVVKYGINKQCGLIVNSSRAIIYVSKDVDFAEKARAAALEVKNEMDELLKQNKL